MPKALHDALEREADKKGLAGDRKNAFIYGTMRNTGWKPEREKKAMFTFEDKLFLLKAADQARRVAGVYADDNPRPKNAPTAGYHSGMFRAPIKEERSAAKPTPVGDVQFRQAPAKDLSLNQQPRSASPTPAPTKNLFGPSKATANPVKQPAKQMKPTPIVTSGGGGGSAERK